MIDFLLGMIVGAAVVGSSVWRTLACDKAELNGAVWSSVINSAAYYCSIHWIAHDNNVAYAGTALGSTAIIIYMTLQNRKAKNVRN